MIAFTATVEKFPHKGGWHFVRLSDDVLADLRKMAGKNGNVPVIVTIGKTSWPSTIMSMGDQQWFVALRSDIRAKEHLQLGATAELAIQPDFSRLGT